MPRISKPELDRIIELTNDFVAYGRRDPSVGAVLSTFVGWLAIGRTEAPGPMLSEQEPQAVPSREALIKLEKRS